MKQKDYKKIVKELCSLTTLTDLFLYEDYLSEHDPLDKLFTCIHSRIPAMPGVVFDNNKDFDEKNHCYKYIETYEDLNIYNLKDVHAFVCDECDNVLPVTNEYVQEACYDHILACPDDSKDYIILFCPVCGKAHIFYSLVPDIEENLLLNNIQDQD